MEKQKGFTLIELLVVIAIIALLMSVLMPALSKARNQARVLSCAANAKQVGTIMAMYQDDNNGHVPVMRNKFYTLDAKSAFLSIPFRNYSGARGKLPTWLPLNVLWDDDQVRDYAQNWLPDFFVCPFARGKSQATLLEDAGTIVIGTETRKNYKSVGRMDSYSTWIWPRKKNFDFWSGEHPWGSPNGYNKYENLVWHNAGSPDPGYPDDPYVCSADQWSCDAWMQENPRKFMNVPRLSKRTALYCATGEIDESSHYRIINYGSHKKRNKGGTTVVFGDSRVEWVQGSQISAGN